MEDFFCIRQDYSSLLKEDITIFLKQFFYHQILINKFQLNSFLIYKRLVRIRRLTIFISINLILSEYSFSLLN